MSRGRPPAGPKLVEGLDGSSSAKERLRIILQTLAGEIGVGDACAKLNVSEARFHELRADVLQAAVAHLEPKTAGRPAHGVDAQAAQIAALKAQVQDLKIDLRATQIREELALLMPHVLKPKKQTDRRERLDALQRLEESEKKRSRSQPSSDVKSSTPNDSNKSGNC